MKRSLSIFAPLMLATALLALVVSGCTAPTVATPSTNIPTATTPPATPVFPPVASPQITSGPAGVPSVVPVPVPFNPQSGAPSSSGSSAITSGGFYPPGVYYGQGQVQNTGIWVTGEGQVSATPDIASISLGFQNQNINHEVDC